MNKPEGRAGADAYNQGVLRLQFTTLFQINLLQENINSNQFLNLVSVHPFTLTVGLK